MYACVLSCFSRVHLFATLWTIQPTRLFCSRDSPGKNPGVGCHALLQGIFSTQGSHPGLLHCRQILYHWATREAQRSYYLPFVAGKLYFYTTWLRPCLLAAVISGLLERLPWDWVLKIPTEELNSQLLDCEYFLSLQCGLQDSKHK